VKRHDGKRGDLTKALIEAIELWIKQSHHPNGKNFKYRLSMFIDATQWRDRLKLKWALRGKLSLA
jgi:hypothetical protein